MTCIVGIAQNDCVWLAGDSAGVNESGGWRGPDIVEVVRPKVFRGGDTVFGYTSSFRMGALLEFELTPPRGIHRGEDVDFYVYRDLPAEIRKVFAASGYGKVKDGRGEEGGTFLLGMAGRLFTIGDDFAVIEVASGYHAVGSGAHLALGSMHTTRHLEWNPGARLHAALEAAEQHTNGVRPPFTIVRLPPQGEA